MAVDADKLEKLIRLANNNPNDNEANLAARKVCKMLENVRFNFRKPGQTTSNSGNTGPWRPPTQSRPSPTGRQGFNWDDVFRSPESFWRERDAERAREQKRAEEFNKEREREERARQAREKEKTAQEKAWEGGARGGGKTNRNRRNMDDMINDILNGKLDFEDFIINFSRVQESPFTEFYKQPLEKKILKCKKCKQDKETGFVGHPSQFLCMECIGL